MTQPGEWHTAAWTKTSMTRHADDYCTNIRSHSPVMLPAPETTPRENSRDKAMDLPTFYYHAHFKEMLGFVTSHYDHVLDDRQRQFLCEFADLSFPAQCLYVRLVNRRGRLFRTSTLRYAEIDNIPLALAELQANGFVTSPTSSHAAEVLQLLTRPQLMAALAALSIPAPSALKKTDALALAKTHITADLLATAVPLNNIIMQGRYTEIRFLLFLFFGQLQDGLTQFTMRDLGLVRAHDPEGSYEPRFADPEEATQAFFFATRLEQLQRDTVPVEHLFQEVDQWPQPEAPVVADVRDELALTLGKCLEADTDAALRVYRQGESVKCSERIIRLLLASGRRDDAKHYLERCLASPASVDEALLAGDIYERKFNKKKTSLVTDLLRQAPTIDLDDAYRSAPEWAAVLHYQQQGKRAFRTENRFWRTLFGLLFWDLLFAGSASSVRSPFEKLPAALLDRRFFSEHREAIEAQLSLLADPKAIKRRLLQVSATHYGVANGLFRWHHPTLDAIQAFLDIAPPNATAKILRLFCQDYLSAKHGYPDLLVIEDEHLTFIEIKADGDQLRRNQLLRLQQLHDAGFNAEIRRVRWVIDATQPYVVVDVETTGGKGSRHRVTEIGAVKVLGDQIVDTFHTLLNPGRPIPPGITRLTGISDAMVAGAPVFADIAEAFAAFASDAIFVAHNVEFDYGFISAEFERMGQAFRRPKLCTCASMRKLFPGQDSYGLAALCAAYDIPLKTHHRALCDAEAAAQLLLIINERRREILEQGDPI